MAQIQLLASQERLILHHYTYTQPLLIECSRAVNIKSSRNQLSITVMLGHVGPESHILPISSQYGHMHIMLRHVQNFRITMQQHYKTYVSLRWITRSNALTPTFVHVQNTLTGLVYTHQERLGRWRMLVIVPSLFGFGLPLLITPSCSSHSHDHCPPYFTFRPQYNQGCYSEWKRRPQQHQQNSDMDETRGVGMAWQGRRILYEPALLWLCTSLFWIYHLPLISHTANIPPPILSFQTAGHSFIEQSLIYGIRRRVSGSYSYSRHDIDGRDQL